MDQRGIPQAVSPEEDARIVETPALFANKVYLTQQQGGAKLTFAETRRDDDGDRASPRVAVFLQHADLAALHRLLDATVKSAAVPGGAGTTTRGTNGGGTPERH
ncbi:MAG: hypothetical protein OXI15_21755 [Chromatiales bacterium]|nr:hypothetical protein [Chromatiales bacterium]